MHLFHLFSRHKVFLSLFTGYAAIRGFSFLLFLTTSPTHHSQIKTIVSLGIIGLFFYLYKKSPLTALFLLFTELTLGGAGHYLEFFNLSLRTCLTVLYITLFYLTERKRLYHIHFPKPLIIFGSLFCLSLILSIFIGWKNGHPILFIIQDAIPFISLLLFFPLITYWNSIIQSTYTKKLISVFILGNTLFSFFTLFLFSYHFVELQAPYYKWFRDISMGKITDMGTGFFRIVLPEHLLLVPFSLLLTSFIITNKNVKAARTLQVAALLTITTNFSRIYLLGLGVALLFLFSRHYVKRWIKESGIVVCVIALLFTGTHLFASHGKSFGFELFGARAKSLIRPETEISSATRMSLLPDIFLSMQEAPVFGSGIGASVLYVIPTVKEIRETRQFDWGYFELIVELGFLGFSFFVAGVSYMLYLLFRIRNTHWLAAGMLSSMAAMLFINITAPIFTHALGIIFLIFVISFVISYQEQALPALHNKK